MQNIWAILQGMIHLFCKIYLERRYVRKIGRQDHSLYWACFMLICFSQCQEYFPSPAWCFASHLWNSPPWGLEFACRSFWVPVLTSEWEEISAELSPPAHHLVLLTSDQQLVEERAVGERESTMLECWLYCREEKLICKQKNEASMKVLKYESMKVWKYER